MMYAVCVCTDARAHSLVSPLIGRASILPLSFENRCIHTRGRRRTMYDVPMYIVLCTSYIVRRVRTCYRYVHVQSIREYIKVAHACVQVYIYIRCTSYMCVCTMHERTYDVLCTRYYYAREDTYICTSYKVQLYIVQGNEYDVHVHSTLYIVRVRCTYIVRVQGTSYYRTRYYVLCTLL